MEVNKNMAQGQEIDLEDVNEKLLDILSLVIVLESDMEIAKADDNHVRIIKMIHSTIKDIQKSLSVIR